MLIYVDISQQRLAGVQRANIPEQSTRRTLSSKHASRRRWYMVLEPTIKNERFQPSRGFSCFANATVIFTGNVTIEPGLVGVFGI